MGIKGSTDWFTTACLVKTTPKELRLEIIRYFNLDKEDRPVMAIDASVWVRKLLGNPRDDSIALSQYHANPLVPVTAAADYFDKRIDLLRSMKVEPVLVFDGQINPLKSQEHNIRQQGNADRQSLMQQLTNMYNNPELHNMKEVIGIQKQLMSPRKDILYEIIKAARKKNVKVVGAPFETDTQIVALLRQGVIHGAISTDSDYTAMGVPFVISDLVMKGAKVEVRYYEKLTKEVLPKLLGVTGPVVGHDIDFLVHMLGTDNLPKGLKGSGPVDVIKRMKEYLSKQTRRVPSAAGRAVNLPLMSLSIV
jgi:5'-3' exonuclease